MKRMTVWLSAFVALVLAAVNGAVPVAAQAVEPGNTPAGLAADDWQAIQDQLAKLTAADGAAEDEFGTRAALSGDTAIVAAPMAAIGGNEGQGAAYIFYRNQGGPEAWGQVAKLAAADGAPSDRFGSAVSLDGDTAIVGVNFADVGGQPMQGAAYIFSQNQGGPDTWGQVAKLTAADGAMFDWFGYSVSVSGDTAIVGAPTDDGDTEAAYVFYRNDGGPDASLASLETEQQWGQVAKLTAPDGVPYDDFGSAVAVDGDIAIVGAHGHRVGGLGGAGAAYIFYRNQGGADAWGLVAELNAADVWGQSFFGYSVSLDGDTAVVGAPEARTGHPSGAGAAYVFYRDRGGPDTWGQVAKLIGSDKEIYNSSAYSVSVSGDVCVVGNMLKETAYVYRRDQGGPDAWGQVAKLFAADGAEEDYFGYSVAVDGGTALVGSRRAWVGGNEHQGAAYAFSLPGSLLLHLNWTALHLRPGPRPGVYFVTGVVRVRDQDDAPAADVTVFGYFWLQYVKAWQKLSVTNARGQARFSLRVQHTGYLDFCAENLVKSGYGYAPGENDAPACRSMVIEP